MNEKEEDPMEQQHEDRNVMEMADHLTTWRLCEFCKEPAVTMAYGAMRYRVFYVYADHARQMGASDGAEACRGCFHRGVHLERCHARVPVSHGITFLGRHRRSRNPNHNAGGRGYDTVPSNAARAVPEH